ncbi:MAG: HAD-IA family hydrolase [Lentimicrobiaceae bacterium]|nr:HAD-IA family hydrolase [Lentimicrobiaceae bacterium]
MIKLIIFDLDGTLLNTIDDLADSMNSVLQQNGYPAHDTDAYKYFVGDGVAMLVRRALPKEVTEATFTKLLNDFMNEYELRKADKTAPYAGMIETLDKLQEKGILLAVATNKPHELLPDLMAHYFPTIKWAAVFGNRKDVPVKPHPQIVYDILNVTNINKTNVLYVGDTAVDMQTAQNAGLKKVGVLWGFRPKEELEQADADYIIMHPQELMGLI